MTRTALVRNSATKNLKIFRAEDYRTQPEMAQDLRGNGTIENRFIKISYICTIDAYCLLFLQIIECLLSTFRSSFI